MRQKIMHLTHHLREILLLEPKYGEFCQFGEIHPITEFPINDRVIMVQCLTVDGDTQIVLPETLCARYLYLAHHPTIAGHTNSDVGTTRFDKSTIGLSLQTTCQLLCRKYKSF